MATIRATRPVRTHFIALSIAPVCKGSWVSSFVTAFAVTVAKDEQADSVDAESNQGNAEHPSGTDFWRGREPSISLDKDHKRDAE